MSFTVKNIEAAAQILSDRQKAAENLRSERHREVKAKIPEIAAYEAQLAASGLAVVKAFGMGKDAEEYIKGLSEINLTIQKKIKELLKANGYPENYLETPYTCKKCNDTGFNGAYGCSCRKQLLIDLAIKDLERVSPASRCRFDNFKLDYYSNAIDPKFKISPREQMQIIFEYTKDYSADFDSKSGSLYLCGSTGLGKTHLSLAIANVVVRKGYNVIYDSASNLFTRLEKEKFSNDKSGEAQEEMLNCDLLIIDDLGSEFSTQFTVSELYNILNTRLNLAKPTIISTNLTETELEAKYTQRVTSRIIGNFTPLQFIGRDIRQIINA